MNIDQFTTELRYVWLRVLCFTYALLVALLCNGFMAPQAFYYWVTRKRPPTGTTPWLNPMDYYRALFWQSRASIEGLPDDAYKEKWMKSWSEIKKKMHP